MEFFTWANSAERPMGLFSGHHQLVLLFLFIWGIWVVRGYLKADRPKVYLIRAAWFIVFLEAVRHPPLLLTGQFVWGALPLHLCGIGVFIALADAYWENKFTKEVLFMLTLPGAVVALATPDWIMQPTLNFFTMQSFIIHAWLVYYPLMRFIKGEIKPRLLNIWIPSVFLIGVLPLIRVINYWLGTNFFFTEFAAPGTPLVFFEEQFGYFYIPSLVGLIFLVWLCLYGGLAGMSKWASRKNVSPSL